MRLLLRHISRMGSGVTFTFASSEVVKANDLNVRHIRSYRFP